MISSIANFLKTDSERRFSNGTVRTYRRDLRRYEKEARPAWHRHVDSPDHCHCQRVRNGSFSYPLSKILSERNEGACL
ncbi:MAG: site-specific integrase [Clostridia bacterium]|nr:site-specific integrase [Clostridia bacterium]MBR6794531.1 site-specific integrase [Clostridia bacterium]